MNYLLIIILMAFGAVENSPADLPVVAKIPIEVKAGTIINLEFDSLQEEDRLFLSSAYGKTVLKPIEIKEALIFEIPDFMAQKAGLISWQFKDIKGEIKVLPEDVPVAMETYFGPRSIQAGEKDFSMLVTIPVDRFDNPLMDGTPVETSAYFKGDLMRDGLEIMDMFAWNNYYTHSKSGNILISASCRNVASKELVSKVYPALPVDFEISLEKQHEFADGNQVMTLETSVLRDEFGNIVSDGMLVEFLVKTEDEELLTTSGLTINGVAAAGILHPEEPASWRINAMVAGMAKSDIIETEFLPALEDFEVHINRTKEKIVVGPLKSFIGQKVPDGTRVTLTVLNKNGIPVTIMENTSESGITTFNLEYKKNDTETYTFRIQTMGVTKSIE